MSKRTWAVAGLGVLICAGIAWATGGAGDLDASFGQAGITHEDLGLAEARPPVPAGHRPLD